MNEVQNIDSIYRNNFISTLFESISDYGRLKKITIAFHPSFYTALFEIENGENLYSKLKNVLDNSESNIHISFIREDLEYLLNASVDKRQSSIEVQNESFFFLQNMESVISMLLTEKTKITIENIGKRMLEEDFIHGKKIQDQYRQVINNFIRNKKNKAELKKLLTSDLYEKKWMKCRRLKPIQSLLKMPVSNQIDGPTRDN